MRRWGELQALQGGLKRVQVNACRMEIRLTVVAICVAVLATIFFLWDLSSVVTSAVRESHFLRVGMAVLFAGILVTFLFGNLAYFVSRIGGLIGSVGHRRGSLRGCYQSTKEIYQRLPC